MKNPRNHSKAGEEIAASRWLLTVAEFEAYVSSALSRVHAAFPKGY
jgi:hypothetical protein